MHYVRTFKYELFVIYTNIRIFIATFILTKLRTKACFFHILNPSSSPLKKTTGFAIMQAPSFVYPNLLYAILQSSAVRLSPQNCLCLRKHRPTLECCTVLTICVDILRLN